MFATTNGKVLVERFNFIYFFRSLDLSKIRKVMDSQKVSRTRSRTPLPNEKYAFPPVFSPTSPPVSPALQIQLIEILEGQRKLSRHFDNLLALPHPQILGRSHGMQPVLKSILSPGSC